MFLKMLANAALLLVAYTEDEKPWLIVSTFVALLVFPEIIFLMLVSVCYTILFFVVLW